MTRLHCPMGGCNEVLTSLGDITVANDDAKPCHSRSYWRPSLISNFLKQERSICFITTQVSEPDIDSSKTSYFQTLLKNQTTFLRCMPYSIQIFALCVLTENLSVFCSVQGACTCMALHHHSEHSSRYCKI